MKKIIKVLKGFSLFSIFSIGITNLVSCSSASEIYLANFQNYMSSELQEKLKGDFKNLNYRYYGTNEDLERSFEENYDLAIPSSYLIAKLANAGKLEKINWIKFRLKKLDENGNETDQFIETAKDALSLFTPNVQIILTEVYKLNGDPPGGLLNYCVPYFLQDFVFCYKQKNNFSIELQNSWFDIASKIGNITGEGKTFNKISIIDDYRSIYSIPRLIETKDSPNPTVNPINSDFITIDDFYNTYKYLTFFFKEKNSFYLNSDSNTILNNFANLNGSDAGIMYNGDILYAFQGGDNYSDENEFKKWLLYNFNDNDFGLKIVRPEKTLTALDGIVINKNSNNKDQCYEIIKRICLEGSNIDLYESNSGNNIVYNQNSIIKKENNEYVYGPMINFNYVQYTSPLRTINEYVKNSLNGNGYFTSLYNYLLEENILTKEQFQIYIKSLVNVYDILETPNVTNTLEQGLSDINKSNMYYAFQKIKKEL